MVEASLLALLNVKVNLDDIERFSSYNAVYTLLSPLQNQSVSAVQKKKKKLFIMRSIKTLKKKLFREDI